jgi:hypothetical protein
LRDVRSSAAVFGGIDYSTYATGSPLARREVATLDGIIAR